MKKRCMQCMNELNESMVCGVCQFDNASEMNPAHALPMESLLNGKYLIGKVIGEGGFGITYIAWDTLIETVVAIKEYYPAKLVSRNTTMQGNEESCSMEKSLTILSGEYEQAGYKKGLEKFADEAARLAKFNQMPGVVSVKDFFYENNTAYMVMEYIRGVTLKAYLALKKEKMNPGTVFQMMKPVIKTLEEIHKQGVIHRDISPDNIMITQDGQLKLIDFGAARFIDANDEKSLTVILKHGYAPEEQYRSNGKQGPWTDVYALCAVMYRMIFGEVPSDVAQRMIESEDLVLKQIKGEKTLNGQEKSTLLKGLAVKTEKRYQSMAKLYSGLYGKKNVWPVVAAGILGLAVIGGCFVFVGNDGKNTDENTLVAEIDSVEGIETKEEIVIETEGVIEIEESEMVEEPEYIRVLREYYNENLMQYAAKTYFVDLTGDGQDEMIAVYRICGEDIYFDSESIIEIYTENNEEIIQIFCERKSNYPDLDGSEYVLALGDGGIQLMRRDYMSHDGSYRYFEIVGSENNPMLLEACPIEYATFKGLIDPGVSILSTRYVEDFKNIAAGEILEYKKIIQDKQVFDNILQLSFEKDNLVIAYSLVENSDSDNVFIVTTCLEKDVYLTYENFNIWFKTNEKLEKVDIFWGDDFNTNLGIYQYHDAYVLQFGKEQHFAIEVLAGDNEIDRRGHLIYCCENDISKKTHEGVMFCTRENGEVYCEGLDDETDIFYYDSQYVQYGLKKYSVDIVNSYWNWEETQTVIEEAITQDIHERFSNDVVEIEELKLIEVLFSANGYYYLNYEAVIRKEDFEIYNYDYSYYAKIKVSDTSLSVIEVKPGIKYIQYGVDFPVYYGEGQNLVKPSKSQWELLDEIKMKSTASTYDFLYEYNDFDDDGIYEMFANVMVGDTPEIWYSDGTFTEKVVDLEYGFEGCDVSVLQFGKNKHYMVRTYPYATGGYCTTTIALENKEPKIVMQEENVYLYSEAGKTYCDTFVQEKYNIYGDGRYYEKYSIFYMDGTYYEYGSKEIKERELDSYSNYPVIIDEAIEKFVAENTEDTWSMVDYNEYPYVAVENVLLNSENGEIVMNIRHWMSEETKERYGRIISEDELSSELVATAEIPCQPTEVILKPEGDTLTIVDVKYGYRETKGTDFPAIYPE